MPDPAAPLIDPRRHRGVLFDACVVFEDSEAGVSAARRGGFALVLGVDRTGDPGQLIAAGASAVVSDLAQVRLAGGEEAI